MSALSLTAVDRMSVGAFLPKKEDMLTMILARQIQRKCELTEAELAAIDAVVDPATGQTRFTKAKADALVVDTELSDSERNLLLAGLDRLNREKGIVPQIVDLAEKINSLK